MYVLILKLISNGYEPSNKMYEAMQNVNFLTNSEKPRNQEFDQTRKALQQNIDVIRNFINKTQRKWTLLEAKLKKERLMVRTALTKCKLLLAEMEIYIVENVINHRCQESPNNIDANGEQSRSNATPSPSTSKKETHPGTNFESNYPEHHIVTPSSRKSLSPLKSSNKVSSKTSSSSPKSKRAILSQRAERDITFKNSRKTKVLTPYSRNNRKSGAQSAENQLRISTPRSPSMGKLNSCGNTQGSVVENLPRNSTPRSPSMGYLNSCGNTQGSVVEKLPRNSTPRSPSMGYLNSCGNTQGSVVEKLPRNSTPKSASMGYLNSCGNTQGSVVEKLPRNSTPRSPSMGYLNSCGNCQGSVLENLPRNSTPKSPSMGYLNSCGNTQCSVVANLSRNSTPRSPKNTPSEHRNVKESVLKKTSTNTNKHLEINKSLTESMMSEFDKTFNKENVSVPKNAKKHYINPAENINTYKKLSSNNSHTSHTTRAAEIKSPMPSLHPGDPRKYPSRDTERDGPSKSPMSLPVPGINWAKPASQLKEIEEKQRSDLPSHTNSVQTPELAKENFYFRPISPKYLIQNYKKKLLENSNSGNESVTSSRNEGKKQVVNTNNNLSHSSQNSDSLNITFNRHISVPVPPMYEHSRDRGSYSKIEIPQTKKPGMRFNLSSILDYPTNKNEYYAVASP